MIAFVELAVHWKTDHTNHLLIVLTFCGLAAALAEEIADDHTFGIFVAIIAPRDEPDAFHGLNHLRLPTVLNHSARHAER